MKANSNEIIVEFNSNFSHHKVSQKTLDAIKEKFKNCRISNYNVYTDLEYYTPNYASVDRLSHMTHYQDTSKLGKHLMQIEVNLYRYETNLYLHDRRHMLAMETLVHNFNVTQKQLDTFSFDEMLLEAMKL